MAAHVLTPFELRVSDEALQDLRARLARVRFPDEPPVEPWTTGTSVAYMLELVDYWRDRFDWRTQEARLNAFRQFTVPIAGIDLHFICEEGKGPDPMPLLISHGWPGSVIEFLELIPMLTDPARFGGDPGDAFTVIAPSLPGYTLSFRPGQERFGVERIAEVYSHLMTAVLGYERYGVQGGDWGAFVASRLGYRFAQQVTGIHLNLLAVRRDQQLFATPIARREAGKRPPSPASGGRGAGGEGGVVDSTDAERRHLVELKHWLKEETGYQWIQGTRPTTLAFALTDSPAGLAAWIVEKFRAWTDCGGVPDNAIDRDTMLANITLYWVTGAIGSSFWPYHARMHGPWPIPEGATVDVPTGYAEFPREILRPPRSLAERTYTDIRRWSVMGKGGHFAALEQPQALAGEIREFFRPLRPR